MSTSPRLRFGSRARRRCALPGGVSDRATRARSPGRGARPGHLGNQRGNPAREEPQPYPAFADCPSASGDITWGKTYSTGVAHADQGTVIPIRNWSSRTSCRRGGAHSPSFSNPTSNKLSGPASPILHPAHDGITLGSQPAQARSWHGWHHSNVGAKPQGRYFRAQNPLSSRRNPSHRSSHPVWVYSVRKVPSVQGEATTDPWIGGSGRRGGRGARGSHESGHVRLIVTQGTRRCWESCSLRQQQTLWSKRPQSHAFYVTERLCLTSALPSLYIRTDGYCTSTNQVHVQRRGGALAG
jgi:hypothetical protein